MNSEENHTEVMATPPTFDPADVRSWIDDLCKTLDISPTALSKEAGIAPSTINKFINGSSINKNLSGSSLMSIGIAVARIAAEKKIAVKNAKKHNDDNILLNNKTEFAAVCGIIGHGHEKPTPFFTDKSLQRYTVVVPRALRDSEDDLIAFELREEGNNLYPNGTIVITKAINDPALKLMDGYRVVVFSVVPNSGWGAASVYEYHLDPRGFGWLMPTADEAKPDDAIFLGKQVSPRFNGIGISLIVASIQPEPYAEMT